MIKYAALDLGSKWIKLALGDLDDNGNLELNSISQVHSNGIVRGIIYNKYDASRAIERVVNSAVKDIKSEQPGLVCNINGQHISSIKYSDSEPLDNFCSVYIQMAALSNVKQCIKNVGLTTDGFVPESIAPQYSINEDATIVFNLGHSLLNVSICYKRRYYHIFAIAHSGSIVEAVKTCACEVYTHPVFPLCSTIVLCGGCSYYERLFTTIKDIFPTLLVKNATFSGFRTQNEDLLKDRGNATVLGLLQYARYIQKNS